MKHYTNSEESKGYYDNQHDIIQYLRKLNNDLTKNVDDLEMKIRELSKELEDIKDDKSEFESDIYRYLKIISSLKQNISLLKNKLLISDFISMHKNNILDREFEEDYLNKFIQYILSKME